MSNLWTYLFSHYRWEFLSGETSNSNNKASGKSSPSKLFRRKLQKRIMHQKQELMDFQVKFVVVKLNTLMCNLS